MLPADHRPMENRLRVVVIGGSLFGVALVGMGVATTFLRSRPVWEHPSGGVWTLGCHAAAALALFGLAGAGAWARSWTRPHAGPRRLVVMCVVVLVMVEVGLVAAYLVLAVDTASTAVLFAFISFPFAWSAYQIIVVAERGDQAHPGRRVRGVAVPIVGIIVLFLLMVGMHAGARVSSYGPAGSATPGAAFAEYIDALAARDRDRLREVVNPRHYDSESTLDDLIAQLGGRQLVVTDVQIVDGQFDFKEARFTGSLGGTPICPVFTLDLFEESGFALLSRRMAGDGRWFVRPEPYADWQFAGSGCEP